MRLTVLYSSLLACALASSPATAADPLVMHGVYAETYPGFAALVSAPLIDGRPAALSGCRVTLGAAGDLPAAGTLVRADKAQLPPLRILVGIDNRLTPLFSNRAKFYPGALQDLAAGGGLSARDEIAIVCYGDPRGGSTRILLEPTAQRDTLTLSTGKIADGARGTEDRFLPVLDKLLSFAGEPGQRITHRNAIIMLLHGKSAPSDQTLLRYQKTALRKRATSTVPVYVLCPKQFATAALVSFCVRTGGGVIPIDKASRQSYAGQLRSIPSLLLRTQYAARFQLPSPSPLQPAQVGRVFAQGTDHNGGGHTFSAPLAFQASQRDALGWALARADERFEQLTPTVVNALAQPRQFKEMFAERQCQEVAKAAQESLTVIPDIQAECRQFLGELQAIRSPKAKPVETWIHLLGNAAKEIDRIRLICELLLRGQGDLSAEKEPEELLRQVADYAQYSDSERSLAGFRLATRLGQQATALDRWRTAAALFAKIPEPDTQLRLLHLHSQAVLGNAEGVFQFAFPLLEADLSEEQVDQIHGDLKTAFLLVRESDGTEQLVRQLRKHADKLPLQTHAAVRQILLESMSADVAGLVAKEQYGEAVKNCHSYSRSADLGVKERQAMRDLLAQTLLAQIVATAEAEQYADVILLSEDALQGKPIDDKTKAAVRTKLDTAVQRQTENGVAVARKRGDWVKAVELCDSALQRELLGKEARSTIQSLRNEVAVQYAEAALEAAADAESQRRLVKYCSAALRDSKSGYTKPQTAKLRLVCGVATYRSGDWNPGLSLVDAAVREDPSLKAHADKLIAQTKQGEKR
jgi:hypothetical protein